MDCSPDFENCAAGVANEGGRREVLLEGSGVCCTFEIAGIDGEGRIFRSSERSSNPQEDLDDYCQQHSCSVLTDRPFLDDGAKDCLRQVSARSSKSEPERPPAAAKEKMS